MILLSILAVLCCAAEVSILFSDLEIIQFLSLSFKDCPKISNYDWCNSHAFLKVLMQRFMKSFFLENAEVGASENWHMQQQKA